ncbi:MAG TPA: hypothetical protein VM536_14935 [Chloroflexia bacterium]|nr:hypothetical protein [Chloroflexia bacterium]
MLAYVGLILGLIVLVFAIMAFTGSAAVATAPAQLRRPGDTLWLAGLVLIALALMLGFVGSLLAMNLFIVRLLLGIGGLVLLGLAWPRGTGAGTSAGTGAGTGSGTGTGTGPTSV